MDILDTVREIKPEHTFTPSAAQTPRRALHREMARSDRAWPLKRAAMIAVGGAAAAAVAVTASTFAPPGTVSEPQAASASTMLNETADSIRAAAGQPTEITIQLEQLLMVGGPDAVLEPFGSIRAGAAGAVVAESSDTYVTKADGGSYTWTSTTDFHASDVYGDTAAVEAAWNSYYGATHIGELGAEPTTSAVDVTTSTTEYRLPVPIDAFPAEPRAFLDAWASGMDEMRQEKEAARAELVQDEGGPGDPFASITEEFGQSTAEHMLKTLATSIAPHIAPPAYLATYLEALALADDIKVEDASSASKVLVYESSESRYRLTLDPSAGAIISAEKFELQVPADGGAAVVTEAPLVEVGSASFIPEGTPDYAIRVRSVPAS